MSGLEELFAAVRQSCTPRAWSRGIELSRADAVDGVERKDGEVVLRVKSPGRTVAPLVHLYLDDDEWECSCDDGGDACEHVAAATIALRQARKAGKPLPVSKKAGGRVGYRLAIEGDRLLVERVIVDGESERPLEGSLSSLLAGDAAGVEPSQADLSIDRFVDNRRTRSMPHDSAVALVPLLAEVEDVRLAGEPVRVVAEPLKPRAVLEARDGAHRLRMAEPAALEQVLMAGLGLSRDGEHKTLRPLGATELAGLRHEKLPLELRWSRAESAELLHERLPRLENELDLEVRCPLPRRDAALRARPIVDVEQRGAALSVLGAVVYGDPPCARLDGDRLVHLGGPTPARDRRAEREAARVLCEALGLDPGRRREALGEEAIELAERLRAFDGEVLGAAHLDRYGAPLAPALDVEDPERFDVRFETENTRGEPLRADPADVLAAWERGESVVPLLDGGWARLPAGWLEAHGARVRDLLAARDARGALAGHARPLLVALCDALERPRPSELATLGALVDGFTSLPRAELPADLRAELRPYQRAGVDWLAFLRQAGLGGLLADDMGLGKTLQALCVIRPPALVICPTSVMHGWAEQLARFRPALRVAVYHGSGRAIEDEADVTITTYALLRRDLEALAQRCWQSVVLDEAQAIKNPDTEAARAAFSLEADFRLCLSGTPVENRLEELWSQMHFANPGMLGGRSDFRARYEAPIAGGDGRAAASLRERIRPFVLRRLKEDVAPELPPRTEAVLRVDLDAAERGVYDAVLLATRRDVLARLEEGGGNVLEALEALLRLRQAACDAVLVPGQASLERRGPSSKLRLLLEQLDQTLAGGHKALVFSQWTSLLDRIEPELSRADIAFCRLDGSTRDRGAVVERFQQRDGPPVMLLSLKAGGVGLNLTAADHVFLLDPWWNPAAEDQAADRAHRIGQDRPVMIYRLVASDTVEERILALQEHKRALSEAALGDAEAAAALTREDLLALLR